MIEFEQAGFSYGGGQILSELDLSIRPGSFHFLTGPSGAGKTTFLRLCYLDLKPTQGRMAVFEQDVARADRDRVARLRQQIGVVHQDCQFLDHLSLRENVALPLQVAGRDARRFDDDIDDLLSWVGLDARSDALPAELSGGERQRAALARAVIMAPEMIVADEPTGNIDWEMGLRVLDLLIELNRMGKTILIATHDLNLIRSAKSQVEAHVLRLRSGRLQQAEVAL
ncbi:cell division ATP-binding protein FtsE [Oceanomicrobium pacificus]|uniref:ATP-binding cassette domain-containing protein n=1 Tax=Oceanomicrobium pacificus TaxID=2692916 RepID=A0A6B0TRJ8_9RHOB|nr:ATP-binding cassette domain-containing protein [Oceanomicrobium pacificus]MXU63984.1 ATP-binding cassette domain-containing protein [Oceanomicrobium pacificus]